MKQRVYLLAGHAVTSLFNSLITRNAASALASARFLCYRVSIIHKGGLRAGVVLVVLRSDTILVSSNLRSQLPSASNAALLFHKSLIEAHYSSELCAGKQKCTYLASNARANTPAASGAAADVPE